MDKESREAEGITGSPGGQEEAACQALARICLQDQSDGSCRAGRGRVAAAVARLPEEDRISHCHPTHLCQVLTCLSPCREE